MNVVQRHCENDIEPKQPGRYLISQGGGFKLVMASNPIRLRFYDRFYNRRFNEDKWLKRFVKNVK